MTEKILSSYPLKLEKELKENGQKRAKQKRQSFNQYVISLIEKDLLNDQKGV